jgi:pteridine reductase
MSKTAGYQPLAGRVVMVTGGARRIGAALSRGLHDAGAQLVIHCKESTSEAESLCESLESHRPNSTSWLKADLLDYAALPDLARRAADAFGRLDALINNASTFYPTPVGSITGDDFDDLIGTNLKAPLFLSQAAAPYLSRHNGTIINLVDIHSRRPLPNHAVYCAAKAGLEALTRSLAKDLAPSIRVNAIAPGAILWPETGLDDSSREEVIRSTALERAGDPGDIVACARYLIAEAGYVTGQTIAVDGGRGLGW